jgi:flagellar hook-associated protein 1 FlgK
MGGLSGTMALATQSLVVDEGAMEVASNNIANANTPGYSREVATFEPEPDVVEGNIAFGQGVALTQVQGIRNQVVELGLQQNLQSQAQVNSYLQPMDQLQGLFNEAQGVGLQTPLSAFFNSLQNLSTNPADSSLRQAVVSAGQTLASAFNQASAGLAQIQTGLNNEVPQAVGQINQLTQQIAQLNTQVQSLQSGGANASQLIDQRDQLVEQLSGLVGVDNISADDGTITLTTTNGALLVSGQQSFALQTDTNSAGNQDVFSQGSDITAGLTGGSLGGYIQARDQGVASAQTNLDNLAASLTSAVNNQQALGYDLNGNAGVPFFTPFTPAGSSNSGAAAQMQVASAVAADPSLIAASSVQGVSGDNGNATALANILNQQVIDGQTPMTFYSNYVSGIGTEVSQATSEQTAQNLVVQQLQNQKASISGVDLDEESANLIQYQTAYSAAARVINMVSQLAQTAITLGQGD